jgi:uncharacterized protein YbjT (DUF2867 family)
MQESGTHVLVKNRTILLTGATGYVGGRLRIRLENRSERLRCLARNPEFLKARVESHTEIVTGDARDPDAMRKALKGVSVAYYLVHLMSESGSFSDAERKAARVFAAAAREAGVDRIIYLGGLGRWPNLSKHLHSRQEVGRILRSSGVPTIEFRTSIIIGSGSLSFEMVRSLVRRLPLIVMPHWMHSLTQPIAVEDILDYLEMAVDIETSESLIYEVGGADQITYADLIREYAQQRGLKRFFIPVPFVTHRPSGWWISLVTPLYSRVGKRLIDSVRNDTVVENHQALEDFTVRPRGIKAAIARALTKEDEELAATKWSDALSSNGPIKHWIGISFGGRLLETRTIVARCAPEFAFMPIEQIGGKSGWYFGDWMWGLRGLIDQLVGGVGLRRGRRDPERLVPGDAVDFWRVAKIERNPLFIMEAEIKVPGRAWLQFELNPVEEGSRIRLTAIFDPVGVTGLIYWYSMYPFHGMIFTGMLKTMARLAESEAKSSTG